MNSNWIKMLIIGLGGFAIIMSKQGDDNIVKKLKTTNRDFEISSSVNPNDTNRLRNKIERQKHSIIVNDTQDINIRLQNLESQLAVLSGEINQIKAFDRVYQYGNSDIVVDMTPEEDSESLKAETDTRIWQIDDTFSEQTVDPMWAETIALTLDAAFEKKDMEQFYLRNVDCRSTLCRLEIEVDQKLPTDESVAYLTGFSSPSGEVRVSINDDNPYEAVVYMARDGYSIQELID